MADETRCPECGARIDPEAPCSACLMKLGMTGTGSAPGPPERIGPYHLRRRLGEGGMGEVWEADQEEPLRRKVAVKLIKPGMDTRQVIARFESERQALAVMSHPNVAQVFDAGSTPEGRPFFVMEYVEGIPITSYCDRNRLSTRDRLELFIQVCEGVQHAHQKGIIHRDVKPSNILVTERNARPVPKIIDFGVAKATAQTETERSLFTDFGQVVGTPEYMSPEQAKLTQSDIDTRTDIYSLGIVLYELLVGSLPFDSRELRQAAFDEIRRVIREDVPSRPSTRLSTLGELSSRSAEYRNTDAKALIRQLRGDLDWITMKALEKDRTRRYGTAGEFGADVTRYLRNEPVDAGPPSLLYRSRKFVGRHRLGVALVAAVFVLMAGFAVRERMQAKRIATERDTAEQVSEFMVDLFRVSDPGESRGKTITAREILDRGAEKIESDLADRPEVRGRLMKVLGAVYQKLGMYEEAQPLLEDSLALLGREMGEEHPATLGAMHELAMLRRNRGDLAEAEVLALETLARFRKVLGDGHLDTLKATGTVGSVLRARDRLEEAEPYYLEALEGMRRILGPEHPDVLAELSNFAGMLYSRAKYAEAAENWSELLEVIRRTQGEDHPHTLTVTFNMGAVTEMLGEPERAEAYYRAALEGRRRVLGDDHPRTLLSMAALAKILRRLERFDMAEDMARDALEGHRRVLGDDHPTTLFALQTLGYVHWDQGRYRETETIFRELVERRRSKLGNDHQDTARAMRYLGAVLWDMNEHAEAEKYYLEAVEWFRRELGDDHPRTQGVVIDIVGYYQEWGKPDQAAEWREQFPDAFRDEGQ